MKTDGYVSFFIRNVSAKITIQVKKLIICKDSEALQGVLGSWGESLFNFGGGGEG